MVFIAINQVGRAKSSAAQPLPPHLHARPSGHGISALENRGRPACAWGYSVVLLLSVQSKDMRLSLKSLLIPAGNLTPLQALCPETLNTTMRHPSAWESPTAATQSRPQHGVRSPQGKIGMEVTSSAGVSGQQGNDTVFISGTVR